MRHDRDMVRERLMERASRRDHGSIPDIESRVQPAQDVDQDLRRNARYTDLTAVPLWWSWGWNVGTWGV